MLKNDSNFIQVELISDSHLGNHNSAIVYLFDEMGWTMDHELHTHLNDGRRAFKKLKAKIKATEPGSKAGKRPFELKGFVQLALNALGEVHTALLYLHLYIILAWNLCARSDNVTGNNIYASTLY